MAGWVDTLQVDLFQVFRPGPDWQCTAGRLVVGGPTRADPTRIQYTMADVKRFLPSPSASVSDTAPDDASPRSQAPPGSADMPPFMARFRRLLQAAGVCDARGWPAQLYFCLLYGVVSVGSVLFTVENVQLYRDCLPKKVPVVDILRETSFLGFSYLGMWLALTMTFLVGRQRYARLIAVIERSFMEMAALRARFSLRGLVSLRRQLIAMCIFILLVLIPMSLSSIPLLLYHARRTNMCIELFKQLSYCAAIFCFMLISGKFLYAGLLIKSGFAACNQELHSLIQDSSISDTAGSARLRHVGQTQLRLMELFDQLTDAMQCELVLSMAYGVITNVLLLLEVVEFLQKPLDVWKLMMVVLGTMMMATPVGIPCELVHRVRREVSAGQSLLLHVQMHQPQLESRAAGLLAVGARALETAGDLSFFRLGRGTFLTMNATVLTYLIIMEQFKLSEVTGTAGNQLMTTTVSGTM